MKKNLMDIYTHAAIDTDGSIYRLDNRDVVGWDYHNKAVNDVFRQFKEQIEQTLYIIGNYLYFSLDGAKYYISLTSSVEEEEHIAEVIQKIKAIGCYDIVYQYGRLD